MREIIFRGKRTDGAGWIYGDLLHPLNPETQGHYIVPIGSTLHRMTEVASSTVGQFTGLTDKNGKRIWEGDVVRHKDGSTGYIIFLAQTMSYRLVLPETDIAIGHRGMGGGYNHAPMLALVKHLNLSNS